MAALCEKSAAAQNGDAADARAEEVKRLMERIAGACGISAASVRVDGDAKTGCRLTRAGIELMANHQVNEDIAGRARYGVRGSIALAQVDAMVACFVATKAQDFLLADWRRSVPYGDGLPLRAQRYLQTCIDDMAAYARMTRRIAFARRHFAAYLSRAAAHVMASAPLHLQLMRALRLYVLEKDPQLVVSPFITEELGTVADMNPLVEGIARIVADDALPYRERHAQAARLIAKPFSRMLKLDEQALSFYDILHLYDDEQSYGASKEACDDENVLRQEEESAARAKAALETVTDDNIDQLIADNNEPSADEAGGVNLGLPGLSEQEGALPFSENASCEETYEAAVLAQRAVIEEVADILARIAAPQERLSVPRYSTRLVHAGSRLHPRALTAAALQLRSGQERPIWQRASRRTRMQSMPFQGLDIYLLLDTSISMTGENARNAAVMAACLAEGLECAASRIAQDPSRDALDARTQLLAFGEGWAELTPLEATHGQDGKRFAFAQLLRPASEQTLVAGALRHVRDRAAAEPSRDVLCLVVGDGLFADGLQARKCVMDMPGNAYVAHLNIGGFAGLPLSDNFETIGDPSVLPRKLHAVLARRLAEGGEA